MEDDFHTLSLQPLIAQSERDEGSTFLRQFSHASVAVPGTQKILISGGFGDRDGNHGRMEGLRILDVISKTVSDVAARVGSEKLGE